MSQSLGEMPLEGARTNPFDRIAKKGSQVEEEDIETGEVIAVPGRKTKLRPGGDFMIERKAEQVVYVVDDDGASRQSIAAMLRSVGYMVEVFDSGSALLERARDGLSGCIVLDVRMPGVSGLEVQKRLASLDIHTPVIVVSGFADIAMAVQAMKANAFEFLTKPFRDQDLFDAIGAAMELDSSRSLESRERRHADRLIRNLTAREHEVFVRLCSGQVGKQIAHELGMSEATVKVHRRSILHKLDVKHLGELILTYSPLIRTFADD